ncbi:MAG: hypothetical protein WB996_08135 [Ignavibacteriaceae bacterium]
MIRTIVYMTIAFLLGGIAAVTYFTLTADNNVDKNNKKDSFYVVQAEKKKLYSMQDLDSLTAASNSKFTRRNAVDYSVIDTTAFKKM